MSNRLQATPHAKATRDQLAEAGGLKLTVSAGAVPPAAPNGKRRTPSMPRVTLDNRPTAERTAKAPEGIEVATGTKAHRVRNPLDIHKAHFAPELIAAATRFLKNHEAVETAARLTASYSGMPGQLPAASVHRGGVRDTRRADAAELAFVEAKLEAEFMALLELLVAGVDAHRHNQPKTVGDIARRVLAYRADHSATPAGVGMLWGALVRLASIYVEIRAVERTFSTPEEIVARLQEPRRQATTAKAQFHRECRARDHEARSSA